MKLRINIHPKTGIVRLPIDYRRILSAAVWSKLQANEIKEASLPTLLSISSLLFKERQISSENIEFRGKSGMLCIGSSDPTIIEKLTSFSGDLEIGGNLLDIGKITIEPSPDFNQETILWQTPPGGGICTLKLKDAKNQGKGRQWIRPDIDMEETKKSLISCLNAKWKHFCSVDEKRAIRWCGAQNPTEWGEKNQPLLTIEMVKKNFHNIKKGMPIGYWSGRISVTAHPAWQQLIHENGLGNKTGMGYGFVEVSNKTKII